MSNPRRAQGTRFETHIVNQAQDLGLHAERLPEGGTNDLGDLRILTDHEWIGEAKNRERLNIHQTLEKAIRKSGTKRTFVVWKRLARQAGNQRRSQDGPILVALELDMFLHLLKETA